MSRLYDRIQAFGCKPFRPRDLAADETRLEMREAARAALREELSDKFATPEELERFLETPTVGRALAANQPVARERLDSAELEGLPVIAADDVGAYALGILNEDPQDILDHLAVLAPPFDSFFVEVQGVANPREINAWGLLIRNFEGPFEWDDKRAEDVGWEIEATLVIEHDKNKPIGPVARYLFALDREGRWLRHDDGLAVFAGDLVSMEPEDPPEEVVQQTIDSLVPFLFAGLLAISLMHCRNVSSEEVEPDPRATKRWAKKGRKPLTRYHVLDVGPMKAVLDHEGEAQSKGLAHALHICRGHFKTFTEEAPLFGRFAGTFWWADQVRGDPQRGIVDKSYSVHPEDPTLGRDYQLAEERPELEAPEHSGPDPDVAGRGLAAHNRTQNLLAQAVTRAGLRPRSPAPGEPRYDLAWTADDRDFVVEVKSITAQNEERQLRLALGQVVRYRQQLGEAGRPVQAVIAVERQPSDESWVDLCNEQAIVLCWPEVFDLAVRVPSELT